MRESLGPAGCCLGAVARLAAAFRKLGQCEVPGHIRNEAAIRGVGREGVRQRDSGSAGKHAGRYSFGGATDEPLAA